MTAAPAPRWVCAGAAVIRRLPAGRYRLMDWLCRRAPPPFLAAVETDLGPLRFVCDLRDKISREVCFTGRYERQETAIVGAVLRAGGTFIDIGANWGFFALLAAGRVGPAGRVVAFEPDPRLFRLLEANVAANGLTNVDAVLAAAAAGPGELALNGFDADAGNWGLTRVGLPTAGTTSIAARAVAVDAELDALGVGHADLVKLDVEGAEDLALDGMADGLKARRYARLLVELHPALLAERSVSADDVIGRLLNVGYRAWEVRHDAAFTRAASYAQRVDAASLLSPWAPGRPLGPWPHLLFAKGHPLPADGLR